MTNKLWYPTAITNSPLFNGYCITIETDVPCHLWLRFTKEPPLKHPTYSDFRGIRIATGTHFCFVSYGLIEQIQAGDTLIHTFPFYFPTPEEDHYYYLLGTIDDIVSPSTSPIIPLHEDRTLPFFNHSFEDWPDPLFGPSHWDKFTFGTGWSDWTHDWLAPDRPYSSAKLEAGGYDRGTGLRQVQDATPYRFQTLTFTAQGRGYAQPNNDLTVSVDGTGGWTKHHHLDVMNTYQLRWIIGTIPSDATIITIDVRAYSPGYGPIYTYWTHLKINV